MRKTTWTTYLAKEDGVVFQNQPKKRLVAEKSEPARKTWMSRWWGQEKGMSTAALFILGLPLIIAAFGYGFDSLRFVYVKESLQGTLNRATQAGVTQTVSYTADRVLPTGATERNVALIGIAGDVDNNVPESARQMATGKNVAYTFYSNNTSSLRTQKFLMCNPAPGLAPPSVTQPQTPAIVDLANADIKCAGSIEYVGQPLSSEELCSPLSDETSARYGLRYTVSETVSASFLKILGIQNHYISGLTSVSYVRANSC